MSVGFIAPIDAFDVDEGFVVVPLTGNDPRLAASEGLRGAGWGPLLESPIVSCLQRLLRLPVRAFRPRARRRLSKERRNGASGEEVRRAKGATGDFVARKVDGALCDCDSEPKRTELRLQVIASTGVERCTARGAAALWRRKRQRLVVLSRPLNPLYLRRNRKRWGNARAVC